MNIIEAVEYKHIRTILLEIEANGKQEGMVHVDSQKYYFWKPEVVIKSMVTHCGTPVQMPAHFKDGLYVIPANPSEDTDLLHERVLALMGARLDVLKGKSIRKQISVSKVKQQDKNFGVYNDGTRKWVCMQEKGKWFVTRERAG
jgi:hypothetical protein